MRVYAALDPYRTGMSQELRQVERKLVAGAHGVFTQPFFDLRLMDAFADIVPEGAEVWWGATTVTEEGSLNYWQTRNHAIFPRSFELTMDWDRRFAAQLLAFARAQGQHAYFMPVKTDVGAYLQGIV